MIDDAFYIHRDGSYRSSELTRGPWDRESQHAGPPTALLAREIERLSGIGEDRADRHVGRITFEILRPVPIAALSVEARVVRPGKRVDMVEAELLSAGEPVIRARGWRLLRGEVELPSGLSSTEADGAPARAGRPSGATSAPPLPGEIETSDDFFPTDWELGYHRAIERRFVSGSFTEPGPAVAWLRPRIALVAGEPLTPLQRVMVLADSGNGISSTLDHREHLFINVDLSVHLQRLPTGEWVGMDALTTPEPTGVGLSDTMLFDPHGPLGRACQTLLVARRER